jgi:transposase
MGDVSSFATASSEPIAWYFWLEPIIEAAGTVKRHWNGMLHWFHSNIANGLVEGINRLVQAANAKARRYRSNRNLITMVYLLAGMLDLTLPA